MLQPTKNAMTSSMLIKDKCIIRPFVIFFISVQKVRHESFGIFSKSLARRGKQLHIPLYVKGCMKS